jgi:hypothetical protein
MSAKHVALTVMIAAALTLSGCGGGGGGGGSTSNSANTNPITLTGFVTDPSNIAVVGSTVTDATDNITTTTAAGGAFSITGIPYTSYGSLIVLNFYTLSGQLDEVEQPTVTVTGGQSQTIGTVKLITLPGGATPGSK